MKKTILINLFIFLFILIITELFFRYIFNANVQGISKNLINRNNEFIFNNKNLSSEKVFGAKVYTDQNGFRVPKIKNEIQLEKILFVGGSITFGPAIEAENTFVEIINKKINYNVVNASVFGSNLENNFNIYSNFVDTKTKKVFISLTFDDLSSESQLDINSNNLIQNLKKKKIFKYLNAFFISKSAAYVFTKNFFSKSAARYYLRDLKSFDNSDEINKSIKILDKFNNNKNNIIFYILPYSEQVTKKNCQFKDNAEKYYINELDKRNYNYIFFKDYFCNQKNTKKFYLRNDHAHLSKEGHKFVSKIFLEYIN